MNIISMYTATYDYTQVTPSQVQVLYAQAKTYIRVLMGSLHD